MLAVEREAVITPWNWTDPLNDALWQDAVKTLSDPCPAGWRVPKSGTGSLSPWNALTADSGPFEGSGMTLGRRWAAPSILGGTPSCWYPTPGFRSAGSGYAGRVADEGSVRNSATMGYFRFLSSGDFSASFGAALAYGLPVRCIRE